MNKTRIIKSIFSFVAAMVVSLEIFAQPTENQDFMRSIGKIYVVVSIILLIFLGIVVFLVILDRKINKLEQQIKNNE